MPVPPVAVRRRSGAPPGAVRAAHGVSVAPPGPVRAGGRAPRRTGAMRARPHAGRALLRSGPMPVEPNAGGRYAAAVASGHTRPRPTVAASSSPRAHALAESLPAAPARAPAEPQAAAPVGTSGESRRVEATGRRLMAIACGGEVSTALLPQRLPPACRRDADLRLRRFDRRRRSARRLRRAALVRSLRTACPGSHRSARLGSGTARGRIRSAAAQRGRSCGVGRSGPGGWPAGAGSGGPRSDRRPGRPPRPPAGDPAAALTEQHRPGHESASLSRAAAPTAW